ncbi:hydroxyacid dehydrogenase [Actinoalloteichus hymeniacidonis]|uniref:Lactate dehydrogenase-like oxidoreductase n=1 Tax=Actinoalloteichus hymeniacidonis TaxID=340345 RepID=A0AAC9HUG5_9PSEU|nr:hydroxyacid dehydrogenase [Actinoalloteichus hymeniacidonis]AOS65937.1 lactate dehydrogenase-like oxidoreductase [Actinoalloteichus hymeniacidonis]MBB5905967.1 phosphoglycerate dehydrogenase-like enzyme [Actinoalloteichus hymeniacidonis]
MTGTDLPLVYVPRPVHPDALALLAEHTRVVLGSGPASVAFDEVADEVSAVLVRTAEFRAAQIESAPGLRIIARHGAGADSVDVDAATTRGIPVSVTADANTVAVAEHAIALLLATARRVAEADRAIRRGEYARRTDLVGTQLTGKKLGVIGFGRIGREVARIAAEGFRMRVVAHDPFLDDASIRAAGAQPLDLTTLLGESDAVSLHLPKTPQTTGLLGAVEIDLLSEGFLLVNTSRGGIVDEAALAARLAAGTGGAGLDVFDNEPIAADHPLATVERAVLTPHIGGQTATAMRQVAMDAAQAVLDALAGRRPTHLVNPEVWPVAR